VRHVHHLIVIGLASLLLQAQGPRGVSAKLGRQIVQHYLTAELAGLDTSQATRLYGCKGGYDPSTDYVLPVVSAVVIGAQQGTDTAVVTVAYRVLGRAYLGQHSTFRDSVSSDTVRFAVVRDSTGEARVGCGPHAAEHYSFRTVSHFVSRFDPESRRAWQRALTAVRRSQR
jgi:hypothetical protein